MLLAFVRHAEGYYVKNGVPAAEFGPLALRAVEQRMVGAGLPPVDQLQFGHDGDVVENSCLDFLVTTARQTKVEVKSTCGGFSQVIHVSTGELLEMQASDDYHLYRVYAMDGHTARLRIASDVKEWAAAVLSQFNGLPVGVRVDSISVRPDSLQFAAETAINLTPPV